MVSPLLPGMSDLDAANELEWMLVQGVEKKGLDDVADAKFQMFRKNLRSRSDLADVRPMPVERNRDLEAFWSYAKSFHASWEPRRQHIRAEFAPLFERLEQQSLNPPADTTDSSRWTGRRSASVQARVVLSIAPDAIAGLEDLIGRLELPFHNGGPRDPQVDEALEALRRLHTELGGLIAAAEAGELLTDRLEKLRAQGRATFTWSAETLGMTLRGLPLAGMTTVLACGVSGMLKVLAGVPIAQAVVIGAGAAAANAAIVVKRTPEGGKPRA